MLTLFLLVSAPVPPLEDQARRVIEAQLLSPPRTQESSGLSAEEAEIIRGRYLRSIGERPPRPAHQDSWAGQ